MRLGSIIAALLVAGAVGLWVLTGPTPNGEAEAAGDGGNGGAASAEAEAAGAVVDVVALRSEAQALDSAVRLRGRTEAARLVEVMAQTEGLIVSTPLRKGARVAKGDSLCRIETGERAARIAEAEAKLAQAEIDVAASGRLKERGFAAATTHAANLAELEVAKAQLEEWRIDLARTEIAAPFDGALETDTAEFGSFLQRGSVCATIVELDPIKFVGFAPERAVGALRAGQTAEMRLVTGETREMTLTFVSQSADPDTRTFRVEAQAPNPDNAIRDGMTAEMTVPLQGAKGHLLPHSALTLNDAGAVGVRLVVDDEAQFAPVDIQRDGPEGIWVSGLPESAEVILVGQEFVTDGARVAPSYVSAPIQ